MEAIEKSKGPCVILAGAGTGKTYTIVEKVKHLISNEIYKPERIVCITFSNEAANNVLLRVRKNVVLNGVEPVIRTFHGFSADLLRKYGDRIGISKEFKILDPDQAKIVLHRSLKIIPLNCHKYIGTIGTAKDLGIKLEDFQSYVARELAKYAGIDLDKRLENLSFELQTLHLHKEGTKKKELVNEIKKIRKIIDTKKFVNAWNAYEKIKKKGNYQDYSDLNANALILLEKFPEISADYDYIIVDEFQDTNKIQLDFLIRLASHRNITVVGDVNQSIYRFRGAYKENLNLFRSFFEVSDEDVFNLAKSYRSPNKVLRTAHKLIAHNYSNPQDSFLVENFQGREGDNLEVFELKDGKEEARKVVEIIQREVEKGMAKEDICVMFRAHQHGRVIRKALEEAGIEYSSVSKASLLKQKSVKTAIDYLVVLNKIKRKDKGGEQAFWDLVYNLNFSQEDLIKIGKTIKDYVKIDRRRNDESKDYLIVKKEEPDQKLISLYLFENLEKVVSEKGKMAAKVLIEKINNMLKFSDKPISELLTEVYRISGLVNEQRTREEKEIMLNLNKFLELAKTHEEFYDADLSNFLYYLEVVENLGIEIPASELEEEGVRLMTSHSTKGLEYKLVIVTNIAQGRFPIERYVNNTLVPTELLPEIKAELKGLNEEEIEEFIIGYEKHNQLLEERRLAYVSFTRAKDKLILTYAKEYGNKKTFPSIFLNEIDYKKNPDISFVIDNEKKYFEPEPVLKESSSFVSAGNFEQLLLDGTIMKQEKKEHGKFSPSALLLFDECQKQFEYRYIYNMPEKKTISWDAMRLGSFVHLVLENGVSKGFLRVEDFIELAKEMSLDEDWESVQLNEAETLIKVFFERHKGKYNERTKTEQYLPLKIAGLDFIGFADRIDFSDSGATIIDYKTGKTNISPKDRNWQLGFYALAAKEKYGNVNKVVLDMLKQERPLEFELDEKGNASCVSSKYIDGFNIYEVEQELIKTAHAILEAYNKGFKACSIEKNCDFCNEYVYGL